MSLQVTSYSAPQFTTPVSDAYAWIGLLAVDFTSSQGTVTVLVHSSSTAASSSLPPLDSFQVALGETLVPATDTKPAVTFPNLTELVTQAAQAQVATPTLDPFNAIRSALYTNLANHPKLAGSTQVA